MTAALEMESYSETVPRRKAQFSSKGVKVVATMRDIDGSDRVMDKLSNTIGIKWLEADSQSQCSTPLVAVAVLLALVRSLQGSTQEASTNTLPVSLFVMSSKLPYCKLLCILGF